jgi:hypothetical protein
LFAPAFGAPWCNRRGAGGSKSLGLGGAMGLRKLCLKIHE